MTGQLNGPSTLVIDPAAVGDNTGLVVIKGGLQIDGSSTIINSSKVDISDHTILLASNAPNKAATNGAGIEISGNKYFKYKYSENKWESNIDISANITGNLTGNLTGNVTGSVSSLSNHTTDVLTEGTTNLYDKPVTLTNNGNMIIGGSYPDFTLESTGFPTDTNDLTNGAGFTTFDGDYYSLTNTPTIPMDTNDLTNGAGFTTFDGDYNSLTNTPTIPTDTNDLTNGAGFTTFDGDYNSLTNTPTIPTNNNQLTNGANYTTHDDVGKNGFKFVVMNAQNNGTTRGIYMWSQEDANWGIYMANRLGIGMDGNATTTCDECGITWVSHSTNNGYAVRFRVHAGGVGTGWMWEDSNNQPAMVLRHDGYLAIRSGIYTYDYIANRRYWVATWSSSDDRLKYNESPLSDGLEVIRQLNPVVYDKSSSLTEKTNMQKEVGLVAQEVAQIPQLNHTVVQPPAVSENDDELPLMVRYEQIFTYAIAALQELDAQVQSLKARIAVLEANN